MLGVAQQLHDHFLTLSVTEFVQAFHQFQPALWEGSAGMRLAYPDGR